MQNNAQQSQSTEQTQLDTAKALLNLARPGKNVANNFAGALKKLII